MIPDTNAIRKMWDLYYFPSQKQVHAEIVGKTARVISQKIQSNHPDIFIHDALLHAAALLHDIDKNIDKLPGEHHPDAAVRILKQGGMDEIVEVMQYHPLHMILDTKTEPKTYEQQLLFVADKMTKYSCIGVDARFALWKNEHPGKEELEILEKTYPKVIALRDTLLDLAGISESDLINMVK